MVKNLDLALGPHGAALHRAKRFYYFANYVISTTSQIAPPQWISDTVGLPIAQIFMRLARLALRTNNDSDTQELITKLYKTFGERAQPSGFSQLEDIRKEVLLCLKEASVENARANYIAMGTYQANTLVELRQVIGHHLTRHAQIRRYLGIANIDWLSLLGRVECCYVLELIDFIAEDEPSIPVDMANRINDDFTTFIKYCSGSRASGMVNNWSVPGSSVNVK